MGATKYLKKVAHNTVRAIALASGFMSMNTCIMPMRTQPERIIEAERGIEIKVHPEMSFENQRVFVQQTDEVKGNETLSTTYNIRFDTNFSRAVQNNLKEGVKILKEKGVDDEEEIDKYSSLVEKFGYTLGNAKNKNGKPKYMSEGNGFKIHITKYNASIEIMEDTDEDNVPDTPVPDSLTGFKRKTAKTLAEYIYE